MEVKPSISRITIFPVKSLDGIALQKAEVVNGGCLHHDREYAIADSDGNFIIGKTNPLVHSLRSIVDLENEMISLRHQTASTWKTFHLQKERKAIDDHLSDFFGIRVSLLQNKEGRFLDIPDQSGLTVLSTASLETVAHWFSDMDMEETRRRFRATIELTGVPAFWEDLLFIEEGTGIAFTMGNVNVIGISPRARCVVPTRHPVTGEVIHAFPKTFAKHRAAELPRWSTLDDFGHTYYLSVDCYLPATEAGKWIAVGDEVNIIGKTAL
jgi:uncharacterized protein YcbX